MIPPLGSQTGEELVLGLGALVAPELSASLSHTRMSDRVTGGQRRDVALLKRAVRAFTQTNTLVTLTPRPL